MAHRIPFPDTKPGVKVFVVLFLVLFFIFIFSVIGILIGVVVYGKELSDIVTSLTATGAHADRSLLYLFQFVNQLGFLFAPVVVAAWFYTDNSKAWLRLNRSPAFFLILAGLSIFTILPFINWLGDVNAQMTFPKALSWLGDWMRAEESKADQLTQFFLSVKTPGGLAMNLFIIALVPAVGEELLFRGLLQRLFNEWTRSIPVGVFITAFLFSAIHFQFFGFLPRFLLGLMLGIMLEITQSLWVPVTAHFVNNATLVILYYLHYNGYTAIKMEEFGSSSHFYIILLSLLLTAYLFYRMYTYRNKENGLIRER